MTRLSKFHFGWLALGNARHFFALQLRKLKKITVN
jgi:hypothetical protein